MAVVKDAALGGSLTTGTKYKLNERAG